MKKNITIIAAFMFLFCFNLAIAQEKPLIIKGLYIGMDVKDAKTKIESLLGKNWKVSPLGMTTAILPKNFTAEEDIFGKKDRFYPIIVYETDQFAQKEITGIGGLYVTGEYGFAIIYNDSSYKDDIYEGFISADKATGRVIRMSFSGEIINKIYSAEKINAEDFVDQFKNAYNLPEWYWIAYGWRYSSPKGYVVTIKTDKFLDVKIIIVKQENKPSIKFE